MSTKPDEKETRKRTIEEHIAPMIKEAARELDLVPSLDGTHLLTVRKRNEQFARKTVNGGTEFVLESIYVGKSYRTIFVFRFLDPHPEFATVEIDETKIDDVFPLFAGQIVNAVWPELGFSSEAMPDLIDLLISQHEAEIEAEKEEALRHYDKNPDFGRF